MNEIKKSVTTQAKINCEKEIYAALIGLIDFVLSMNPDELCEIMSKAGISAEEAAANVGRFSEYCTKKHRGEEVD